MFGLFKKSTKITRQIFIVGYNDGLAGVKEFDSLSAAIFEAEGASMMMPNITVRAENGRLIRAFG
jgi:hypothetical protein